MEKQRFNVVLPGDYQEEVLRLSKLARTDPLPTVRHLFPPVSPSHPRPPPTPSQADRKAARPESGNVATRLYFVDPDAQFPQLIGQAASWLLPIVGASLFFKALDTFQTLTGKKKNLRKQMAEEFGRSRASRTIGFGKGAFCCSHSDAAVRRPSAGAASPRGVPPPVQSRARAPDGGDLPHAVRCR